jgi:dTDP-4-dehydrorhamnose reductase
LDITQKNEVDSVLDLYQPDVVINTAAMTNVDACESEREACDALNVHAVDFLVDACNRNHIHFVHVSTDFIFDGTHGPLTEEEKPSPISYYGLSKVKAEEIVQAKSNSWAIARTVLVYGIVSDMSRSNIVLWAKGALESGKSINVVADQFRTPTLAEDLAQGCYLAATNKAKGIYNISGDEMMTPYDIAIKTADFFGLDKSLIKQTDSTQFKQPAARPPKTGFIIDKAKRELGYQPHRFVDGLEVLNTQLS